MLEPTPDHTHLSITCGTWACSLMMYTTLVPTCTLNATSVTWFLQQTQGNHTTHGTWLWTAGRLYNADFCALDSQPEAMSAFPRSSSQLPIACPGPTLQHIASLLPTDLLMPAPWGTREGSALQLRAYHSHPPVCFWTHAAYHVCTLSAKTRVVFGYFMWPHQHPPSSPKGCKRSTQECTTAVKLLEPSATAGNTNNSAEPRQHCMDCGAPVCPPPMRAF